MWPHLESPVRQKKEDDSSNGETSADEAAADDEAAEAESDSGDSLFVTQKLVPKAVRSGRRHHHRHSASSSPESDASSSSSHPKFKMDKETRKKYKKKRLSKSSLPTYSFPFLIEGQQMSRNSTLPVRQNTSLHNSVMGGFFECVREQWQGFLHTSFAPSSLPTVDKEGQCISPLSEDEEERSEDEDIKVVPKKCFVVSTKAKSKQTWCEQVKKQQRRRGEAVKAGQEASQGGQRKMLPAKPSTSRATPKSFRHSSCRVLDDKERNDKHVANYKKRLTQTVTPRVSRHLARTSRKQLSVDSDATDRELQRRPRQHTQKGKAFTTASDPQADVSHTDDLPQTGDEPESQNLLHTDTNNDNVCDGSTVKEREKDSEKDDSIEEEERGQIQEEADGLHATSVNEEVDETSNLGRDNWTEPLASPPTDELESNERNYTENRSLDDAMLIQEEGDTRGIIESDVRMEDSVFSVSCNVDDDGKKRKRSREGDEDVEQLQSDTEPLNDEILKKRENEIVLPEGCEEEEETLESSYRRRKKHQKKQQSSSHGVTQDGDKDVNFSNDAVTSAKSTEVSLTKKKKTVSDGQDNFDTSVENAMFENVDNMTNSELMMKKKITVSDVVDSSCTSEEIKQLKHADDTQKATEGLEDQNTELETPRKRKMKKKTTISDWEDICHTLEENETTDDVDNIQKETESPKNQNAELESPKKKKKTAISDTEDISHTLDANETFDDVDNIQKATDSPKSQNSELETPKKKKNKKTKTVTDEVDISCTYEDNEQIERVDDTQETSEAPEDENAELETPKKKKKKKKTVSGEGDISYTLEENKNIRDVDSWLEDKNADVVTTKKKIIDGVDISHISEENKKVKDIDNIQKMMVGLEEQNAEVETPKKKKKKKTVSSEVHICHISQENEMVESIDTTHKSTEGLEDQNSDLVAMKKKKKKKMASDGEDISYTFGENEKLENVDDAQKRTDSPEDQNTELVTTKKKKKKKTVSHGEDVSFTLEETEKVGNVEDTEKTTESLEDQNAELLSKKKKKRKSISDSENISNIPEENKKVEDVDNTEKAKEDLEGQNPELVTKKKKKKKIGEITGSTISEDSVAQSDDSVSVQKKEKKRTSSFLVADAEENNVQTYRGKKSSSQSVDAHVWGAQKPGVSPDGFETESAEITGSLEETNDGVRKKKRKRKMSVEQDSVEKDHKQDFEEPNKYHVIQDNPSGADEDEALHEKKSKHLTSPLFAKDKHGRTKETQDMVGYSSSEQPEDTFTDKKKKKKRKSLIIF